jgi:hypothetical protein
VRARGARTAAATDACFRPHATKGARGCRGPGAITTLSAYKGALQPHRIRHRLTPAAAPHLATTAAEGCALDEAAPARAAAGARVLRAAALAGGPALEREPPGRPVAPGRGERRESADVRPGTGTAILNRDVGRGQGIAPAAGPARTEEDSVAHSRQTGASAPGAARGHFVVDDLNLPQSASPVRYVAEGARLEADRGGKGQRGILTQQRSRAAFLPAPTHRVVFHHTPEHASWLKQIERGLRSLTRKRLRRGSGLSVADLTAQVLAAIESYNRTMAKPFTWTDTGTPLCLYLQRHSCRAVLGAFGHETRLRGLIRLQCTKPTRMLVAEAGHPLGAVDLQPLAHRRDMPRPISPACAPPAFPA